MHTGKVSFLELNSTHPLCSKAFKVFCAFLRCFLRFLMALIENRKSETTELLTGSLQRAKVCHFWFVRAKEWSLWPTSYSTYTRSPRRIWGLGLGSGRRRRVRQLNIELRFPIHLRTNTHTEKFFTGEYITLYPSKVNLDAISQII